MELLYFAGLGAIVLLMSLQVWAFLWWGYLLVMWFLDPCRQMGCGPRFTDFIKSKLPLGYQRHALAMFVVFWACVFVGCVTDGIHKLAGG